MSCWEAAHETVLCEQVVRHERASVKADMWSYGILVWELISDQDITNLQPLAIAQAMQVSLPLMLHPFVGSRSMRCSAPQGQLRHVCCRHFFCLHETYSSNSPQAPRLGKLVQFTTPHAASHHSCCCCRLAPPSRCNCLQTVRRWRRASLLNAPTQSRTAAPPPSRL